MSQVATRNVDATQSAPLARLEHGFLLPKVTPPFPVLEGRRALLSASDEQDLGFRILMGQLAMMRALAVDTKIIEAMIQEIWAAMGEKDHVAKAVALIFHDGRWIRAGSVPADARLSKEAKRAAKSAADKTFASLARRKLNVIQTLVHELRAYGESGMEDTLFSAVVREELRQHLSEILPYDYILNRAAQRFRSNCKELSARCRDLVKFICGEVRLPKAKVEGIIGVNWTCPKLIAVLHASGGYELRLFPPAEMKRLRLGITQRQKAILEAASVGEAPASEILASWSAFTHVDRDIQKCVGIFTGANFRLVEQHVGRYSFVEHQVVRSAANMGLTRAVYRFAPEMGFRFSTIAMTWLEVSILRDLADQDLVRLPEGMHKQVRMLKDFMAEHPNASVESIVEALSINADDVRDLMHLVGNRMSIDTAFQDEGSGESDGLHATLADPNNDFVREVEERRDHEVVMNALRSVLDERELFVLLNRFGIGDVPEHKLGDLAAIMGLSKERVRQIEMQALGKLRESGFSPVLMDMWGDM